jgi:SagB-type dehydrogenase family enzyme
MVDASITAAGATVAGAIVAPALSLAEGVLLRVQSGGITLDSGVGAVRLAEATPALVEATEVLTSGGSTLESLADRILDHHGPAALTSFYVLEAQLTACGAISRTVGDGSGPLATIRSAGTEFRFRRRPVDRDVPLALSRFAILRHERGQWLLDAPLGHATIAIHDPRVIALIAELSRPTRPGHLLAASVGLDPESIGAILQLLLNAEALTSHADGQAAEDIDPRLAMWDVHDLWFHARSRFGRHAGLFGANYRHMDRFDPLPAIRPLPPGAAIDLPQPNLEAVAAADPPLTQVIEARRSIYPDRSASLALRQLGEFLYRVARVRWVRETDIKSADGRTGTMEISSRPYPGGGRAYELELYLSVDRCEELRRGLYYYDPLHHRLVCVREADRFVEGLLQYASIAAPGSAPAVVVHLAARVGRVSWKYDALAYTTILKDVGVLYQTMYLVATAMGIAACALGSGNADLFAAAAGVDYFTEASVGDFILGIPPPEGPR